MRFERAVESSRKAAHLAYALQAAAFFLALTYIAAAVVCYVKREDARGTWVASHFRWQIRTFWFSLLWAGIGILTVFAMVGPVVLFADAVWVIYRIAKGWLYLSEERPMYAQPRRA